MQVNMFEQADFKLYSAIADVTALKHFRTVFISKIHLSCISDTFTSSHESGAQQVSS